MTAPCISEPGHSPTRWNSEEVERIHRSGFERPARHGPLLADPDSSRRNECYRFRLLGHFAEDP